MNMYQNVDFNENVFVRYNLKNSHAAELKTSSMGNMYQGLYHVSIYNNAKKPVV